MEINSAYKTEETLGQISGMWKEQKSLRLNKFLTAQSYLFTKQSLKALQFVEEKNILSYRYKVAELPREIPQEILEFIAKSIGKKVKGVNAKVYLFGAGDFTILHDSYLEKPGIDFIFDFTAQWNSDWGGSHYYVDGSGEFSVLDPEENTLMVVKRDARTHKFVKYLNHYAQERMFIMGVLE